MGQFYARCAAARWTPEPDPIEGLNAMREAERLERRAREFGPPRLLK